VSFLIAHFVVQGSNDAKDEYGSSYPKMVGVEGESVDGHVADESWTTSRKQSACHDQSERGPLGGCGLPAVQVAVAHRNLL
jgi:hypothetical protein